MLTYFIDYTPWWFENYGHYPASTIISILLMYGASNIKIEEFVSPEYERLVLFSCEDQMLKVLDSGFNSAFNTSKSFSIKPIHERKFN